MTMILIAVIILALTVSYWVGYENGQAPCWNERINVRSPYLEELIKAIEEDYNRFLESKEKPPIAQGEAAKAIKQLRNTERENRPMVVNPKFTQPKPVKIKPSGKKGK